MDIKIMPKPLFGTIAAITSKSAAHRLLICAAFSDAPVKVVVDDLSEDINATVNCLSALGAKITKNGNCFEIEPIKLSDIKDNILLNCGESGSLLRFLPPLAAAAASVTGTKISFTGGGRLPERPLGELIKALEENGAEFSPHSLPFTIGGKLKSGRFTLPGDISSQYISGLMFALPMLDGDSEIELLSPPQSEGYIDMTVSALSLFGVEVKTTANGFFIKGGQKFKTPKSGIIETEKDWSNAAFFLAAGALGYKGITVTELNIASAQGDKKILELLKDFGADVRIDEVSDSISVKKDKLIAQKIDVSQVPDLLPILAVIGACAEGETVLYNAARLRLKESDRLSTVADMLSALGCQVREESDRLIIKGRPLLDWDTTDLSKGVTDSANDHRIAMSAAIAAIAAKRDVVIKDAGTVAKSYPAFFEDYKKLGGECCVV